MAVKSDEASGEGKGAEGAATRTHAGDTYGVGREGGANKEEGVALVASVEATEMEKSSYGDDDDRAVLLIDDFGGRCCFDYRKMQYVILV